MDGHVSFGHPLRPSPTYPAPSGFGSTMSDSPMVIMWPNRDGSVTLSQRAAVGHTQPTVVQNPPRVATKYLELSSVCIQLVNNKDLLIIHHPANRRSDQLGLYDRTKRPDAAKINMGNSNDETVIRSRRCQFNTACGIWCHLTGPLADVCRQHRDRIPHRLSGIQHIPPAFPYSDLGKHSSGLSAPAPSALSTNADGPRHSLRDRLLNRPSYRSTHWQMGQDVYGFVVQSSLDISSSVWHSNHCGRLVPRCGRDCSKRGPTL